MKPIYGHAAAALGLTFAIAACVPAPDSTPAPETMEAPAQIPTPTPTPSTAPVAAAPQYENYLDAPQTAGSWTYTATGSGTTATFGTGVSPSGTLFAMTCSLSDRSISLSRAIRGQNAATAITVRTETAARVLQTTSDVGRMPQSTARVPARDPLLDAVALTRGRFVVEVAGQPTLYLPAWAEVTRVIEDCR